MKKIKINQKLKLNKETVSGLNSNEISKIKGGAPKSDYVVCNKKTLKICSRTCNTWYAMCD